MTCEVRVLVKPDERPQIVPWIVVTRHRQLGALLPGPPGFQPRVEVTREAAVLHWQHRELELTLNGRVDGYQTFWNLPDGGILMVTESAFGYPAGQWFNAHH